MFYKKKGLPEEGDVLLVTVKKILYHSIFVIMDEYQNQEGMIHISEVAPGRIRNIRDYVREGKKLVCLVLRVNPQKGHVDLSLRRVPMSLRNKKKEEHKQEIKSEKLLEFIGKKLNTDLKGMYKKVGFKLVNHFGLLGTAFNEIALHGNDAIKDLNLPKKESKLLVEVVQDKIKPPEVSIKSYLIATTPSENGVDDVRKVLKSGEKAVKKDEDIKVKLTYVSAPKYKVVVFARDYKTAEHGLEKVAKAVEKEAEKLNVSAEVVRKK